MMETIDTQSLRRAGDVLPELESMGLIVHTVTLTLDGGSGGVMVTYETQTETDLDEANYRLYLCTALEAKLEIIPSV